MDNSSGRKRSPVSTLLALVVVGVTLLLLAVARVGSFFRPKYVPVEKLQFPVLVVQPDGVPLFAEWDSTALEKFPEHSVRTPVDGAILIDSEFNQFTQQNVRRQKEGELKWIARFLVPTMRVKYTFDLVRAKASGREALAELIQKAPAFSDNPTEDAQIRSAAGREQTMAGVLDALHIYKPPEPASQPATEPADETPPPATSETVPSDPDKPGPPE